MSKRRVILDRIGVVEEPEMKTSAGGIILPDNSHKNGGVRWGEVATAGPDAKVKAGERVAYLQHAGIVVDAAEGVRIIKNEDVLVVEDAPNG